MTVGVLLTDASAIADGGGRAASGKSFESRKNNTKVIAVNPSQKILVVDPEPTEKAENEAAKESGEHEAQPKDEKADASKQDFDVLLAIMPSSLTEPQMANFLEYVKAGKPTLIFDDPCPFVFQNQSGLAMCLYCRNQAVVTRCSVGGRRRNRKLTGVKPPH